MASKKQHVSIRARRLEWCGCSPNGIGELQLTEWCILGHHSLLEFGDEKKLMQCFLSSHVEFLYKSWIVLSLKIFSYSLLTWEISRYKGNTWYLPQLFCKNIFQNLNTNSIIINVEHLGRNIFLIHQVITK